ncbi:MAG: GGDEF domain-containing protein [Gammaproteobacteria bacterium]|nr:GGDEF domain-containing protein [Gammaproteobacteria bacterium]
MKDTLLALSDLLNMLPDAVVIVDGKGRITFANAHIEGLLGYTPGELEKQSLDRLIPKNYRADHKTHLASFREHGQPMAMGDRPVVYGLDKSGDEVPISVSIANLDLDGERFSIAVMHDSGEVQSEITQVTSKAETDLLTGIGNRLRLSQKLESAIEKSRPFSLLYLDLEKFKPFNDNYGHEVGDKVLQIIGRRLQALVRSEDLAVRLGGDEFVLFLGGLIDNEILEQRAATVADSVTRRFHIGDLSGAVGVNIGGATFPRDGDNEQDLINVADQNMYQAKQAGIAYQINK